MTASDPSHGPTSTAANRPPSTWPEVPLATGKLSIWAANTNAATNPVSAACDSTASGPPALRPALAKRDADAGDGYDAGGDRGGCIDESVGDVHFFSCK